MPTIWLLGSSDYSARLAAEKGLPYVFAHHFSGSGTAEALELYRSSFRPVARSWPSRGPSSRSTPWSPRPPRRPSAGPCRNLLMMVALRTGAPLGPQLLVEEAEKARGARTRTAPLIEAMRSRWVVGDRASARAQLAELAATYGVDEVMVHPVGGGPRRHRPRPQPGPGGDAAAARGPELGIPSRRALD